MQKSLWWCQYSDRYIISLSPHLHTPFSPSLISLMVSADVKHHVYYLLRASLKALIQKPFLTVWFRRTVRTSCGFYQSVLGVLAATRYRETDGLKQGAGRRIELCYSRVTIRPFLHFSPNRGRSLAGGCSSSIWNIACCVCNGQVETNAPSYANTRSAGDQIETGYNLFHVIRYMHPSCRYLFYFSHSFTSLPFYKALLIWQMKPSRNQFSTYFNYWLYYYIRAYMEQTVFIWIWL